MNKIKIIVFAGLLLGLVIPQTVVAQTSDIPWPMAGANPQRTNWTPTQLPDVIATQWVKPIYPLVPQKVQVVGAEGKVYVSTSAGLYAFDASTGADAWRYPTALPLGHSPTYSGGYLYVGGIDKKIHKVRASDGSGIWTYTADSGFYTSPIVTNGKIYATNRDGALYAINDTNPPTLAWKFQTGNQINLSPAFMAENDGIAGTTQGSLYFASNDGYAYGVDAQTGNQLWQSDADPATSVKDKFPSQGFYSWWPVIYGNDVIFTRTGFYTTNGPEAGWLFGASPTPSMLPGTLSSETQSGYWPVGEKVLDIRTNPNGNTWPDYFEVQQSGDTRPQHGPFRRNAFFINRTTGLERQFDLDNDNKIDAAPISWVGDGGTHDPPIVSGFNNVLYFHSVMRARSASFNAGSVFGWKVGTPYVGMTMSSYHSSDEPTGISAAGDKIYYNHCCDRGVLSVNISRPNTDYPNTTPNREFAYISQSGGGINYLSWPSNGGPGLPLAPANYYYNEAVKFFWDPQPGLDPPCCAAVFWNENDKVGPAAYNGKLYVILGNALVALGAGGAGANAPRLASAPNVSPPNLTSTVTDSQLRTRLEQEVTKIVDAGHLKPGYLHGGNITGGSFSREIDGYLNQYWRNPADIHLVLLRALPFLSSTLQSRVKSYLQSEYATYPLHLYHHVGFGSGVQRDPWPYPPLETALRLFNPPQTPQIGFETVNVYAMWKYAKAGLGNAATLLSQLGTSLKTPITANDTTLTDSYLADHPLISNKYIAAYKGYIELKNMAGQTLPTNDPYVVEYNRLLNIHVRDLTTFPYSQYSTSCGIRCYFRSIITYHNFAYMTPELAEYLRTNARSSDPNKNILSILQKYQDIAPYWMVAHNGETQGESAIQPYQQTHSLFQALAMVKRAPREELIKYLDTPIVPVGDLYYIDNLVAILESTGGTNPTTSNSSTPTPPAGKPGDANGDGKVDGIDYVVWLNNYGQTVSGVSNGDFNGDGKVDGIDYVVWLNNYGR